LIFSVGFGLITFFFIYLALSKPKIESLMEIRRKPLRRGRLLAKVLPKDRQDELNLALEVLDGLKVAGIRVTNIVDLYLLKATLAALPLVMVGLLDFWSEINLILFYLMCPIVGWILPGFLLERKIKSRRKEILLELPDVVDLLSSLMEAGLSFDGAVDYLTKHYSGLVSELFKKANFHIAVGKARREAFLSIAQASFTEELAVVMRIIFQAEVNGNPIKEVLKGLAKSQRENQFNSTRRRAEKLGAKMTLVTFVFFLPPMFLIYIMPFLPNLLAIF
jgi:tight adherence protein C